MRSNRTIRLAITLIGLGMLALVVYFIVSHLRSRNAGTGAENVANNPNSVTYGGAQNATHGANNAAGPVVSVALPTSGVVYQARETIPERSIVTLDMLAPRAWKLDRPPVGYVTNPEQQAAGYITGRTIAAGADLMQTDLVGHITKVGVAGAIRPGYRAMVVPIANKATLHELVHIGDYVDIIGTFDQQEARTLVQNVRVLAVDIFGNDFPPVKVAMRGNNKAESYTPPTPTPPPNPLGVSSGQAAAPGPTPGPPPPALEPALTLEVTPDEATTLSLTQASNSPLDFLIHPRSEVITPPVPGAPTAIRIADVNRQQIAPWAYEHKNKTAGPTGSAKATGANSLNVETSRTRRTRRSAPPNYNLPVPPMPPVNNSMSGGMGGGQGLPPAVVRAPQTYEIPIYADGKSVRNDVVLKPLN